MWVQLKRGNDWGRHYLAPEPLTATGFAEASRGLKFSGTVRVLFPDEHEDELPVVNVKTVERVNDMGHESTAVSEVPHPGDGARRRRACSTRPGGSQGLGRTPPFVPLRYARPGVVSLRELRHSRYVPNMRDGPRYRRPTADGSRAVRPDRQGLRCSRERPWRRHRVPSGRAGVLQRRPCAFPQSRASQASAPIVARKGRGRLMYKILKVDHLADGQGLWIVKVRRPDGRVCQAQFSADVFLAVRSCVMGQFLLHAWLTRASVLPEETQPTSPR